MQFTLTINCDNAAFDDHPEVEVSRLLDIASGAVQLGAPHGHLRDINGNRVGTFEFTQGE